MEEEFEESSNSIIADDEIGLIYTYLVCKLFKLILSWEGNMWFKEVSSWYNWACKFLTALLWISARRQNCKMQSLYEKDKSEIWEYFWNEKTFNDPSEVYF